MVYNVKPYEQMDDLDGSGPSLIVFLLSPQNSQNHPVRNQTGSGALDENHHVVPFSFGKCRPRKEEVDFLSEQCHGHWKSKNNDKTSAQKKMI